MTPRELKKFREAQELRRENREMMVMTEIWAFCICFALVLISIWG